MQVPFGGVSRDVVLLFRVCVRVIDNPTQSTLPAGSITFNQPHNLPEIGLDFIWHQCPNGVDFTCYREEFYA